MAPGTVGAMRKPANDKKPQADPKSAHVEVHFWPFTEDTQTTVTLVRGVLPHATRLRVWSGHLPVSRSDLSGVGAGLMTRLLCDALARTLPGPDGEPLHLTTDKAPPGASAPLEGPQGGCDGQLLLPL